ncbi:pentatricopeptide repeat-containing protein [Quercus suber]|uniref:Pentatricopeptide repeat-containing protein n=1 Tax=Quercus suber TaxID=58331 RepID=A0AAW0LIU4_QUESU
MVKMVLENVGVEPTKALIFFRWVGESRLFKHDERTYNAVAKMLGQEDCFDRFWKVVDEMRSNGYDMEEETFVKVLGWFCKRKMIKDVVDLYEFAMAGANKPFEDCCVFLLRKVAIVLKSLTSVGRLGECNKVLKAMKEGVDDIRKELELNNDVVSHELVLRVLGKLELSPDVAKRSEVWSDDVERKIRELSIEYSSDMVKMVLENVGVEPTKALIFFRWVEESRLFKPDERTYNAVAKMLGQKDCIDRFWKVVDEMRSNGYDMEEETFVKVLGWFCKRKMIKDVVDLYEFAMAGANKPFEDCCVFLLRKVEVGKQLDMGLFFRVLRIFTEKGNFLTNSMLGVVLESLTSVGRLGECSKVLKAMKEGGFVANGHL